jgi:adenylate kinase family enzyme
VATVTADFTGAHAFVAGGTSGINLGIAEGFAAAGARVTVMSRSPDKVDAAVRRLRALGAEAGAREGGRSDDTAAVIRHRLDVFATTTSPLIDYYRDRGILLAVDADQPPEAVTAEIQTRLSGHSPIRERP